MPRSSLRQRSGAGKQPAGDVADSRDVMHRTRTCRPDTIVGCRPWTLASVLSYVRPAVVKPWRVTVGRHDKSKCVTERRLDSDVAYIETLTFRHRHYVRVTLICQVTLLLAASISADSISASEQSQDAGSNVWFSVTLRQPTSMPDPT